MHSIFLIGKSELVMFGGIQKDVSSISRGGSNGASSDGDTVSNAVYFLNPPNNVVWMPNWKISSII